MKVKIKRDAVIKCMCCGRTSYTLYKVDSVLGDVPKYVCQFCFDKVKKWKAIDVPEKKEEEYSNVNN